MKCIKKPRLAQTEKIGERGTIPIFRIVASSSPISDICFR